MPGYDAQLYNPPAPLAKVTLCTRDRKTSLPGVVMQIDSGSDVSLVPQSAVGPLGLEVDEQHGYELTAFDGSKRVAKSVQCGLIFLGRIYRGTFLVVETTHGILGRDILNHLSLVLDGLHLNWHEEHTLD